MATIPLPVPKIVALTGDGIFVQTRPVVGVPNEIIVHITRNGAREERFTVQEFSDVLRILTTQLAQARANTLNVAPTTKKEP